MILKTALPKLIVRNPFGDKAEIKELLNILKLVKYTFLTFFLFIFSFFIYCGVIYFKVVLEESENLKNSLVSNVTENNSTENNMILKAFSDIIVREGHISPEMANNYAKWIFDSAYEQKVDPVLVLSIIDVESSFNYQAMSNSNAIGLMQVIYYWHKEKIANKADLYDPKINIKTGTRIIREYLDRSNNEVEALLRYNGSLGQSPIYSMKVLETKQKFNYEIIKKLTNQHI